MSTFQPWHDYTPTINSAAHALFAICRQNCTHPQLEQWRNNQATPNDFMDADSMVIDILLCHDVPLLDDNNPISDQAVEMVNAIFDKASALNRQFSKPYYD